MAENSPIRNKGVGKDAKRHDLDGTGAKQIKGTPGLRGDLQHGDVGMLEAGQAAVQAPQTQGQPQSQAAAPTQGSGAGAAPPPDPIDFALSKVGGGVPAVPTQELTRINTGDWLPLVEKVAASNGASPLLRRAYVNMLSRLQNEPFSGSTAVVDKRELDRQVQDRF